MLDQAFAATLISLIGLALMMLFSRSPVARWRLGIGCSVPAAWAAAATTSALFVEGDGGARLLVLMGAPLLVLGIFFHRIEWPSRLFLASLVVTGVYLSALVRLTFFGALPPLGLGLSAALLALEVVAILLSVAFAYEMADAIGRPAATPVRPSGAADYHPLVCVQVPAYNEPPELLRRTLEALPVP